MKLSTCLILFLLFFTVTFMLSGCTVRYESEQTESKHVNQDFKLYRAENDDVICYQTDLRQGLWCYRKDQNPSCPAPGH